MFFHNIYLMRQQFSSEHSFLIIYFKKFWLFWAFNISFIKDETGGPFGSFFYGAF